MCLAKPIRVCRVEGEIAWVSEEERERPVSLLGVESVVPGDYVLVHAGIALVKLEPSEARDILIALAGLTAPETGDGVTG